MDIACCPGAAAETEAVGLDVDFLGAAPKSHRKAGLDIAFPGAAAPKSHRTAGLDVGFLGDAVGPPQ